MLRAATISGPRLRLVARRGPGVAMPARAPATTRRIKIPPTRAAVARARLAEARENFAFGLGAGLLMAGLHSATGSENDFYEFKFKSTKDPNDIAKFYGGEELMELFCVFPLVNKVMMRMASFDDAGRVTTQGLPGTMTVDMVFSDETKAEGQTDWFNKRERFKDTLFGYTCWDMVVNYGFRTMEDGTYECYHVGEYFHGNLPVVSQVMLAVFKLHARWVAWATEHHINHFAFTKDAETEAQRNEHESRVNMPMFLLRKYALSDLLAMLTGSYDKSKPPSFLLDERPASGESQNADVDTSLDLGSDQTAFEREERDKLPFRRREVQMQIDEDIAADELIVKQMLGHRTRSREEVHDIMARSVTLGRRRTSAITAMKRGEEAIASELEESQQEAAKTPYQIATDLALSRVATRKMTRQATRRLTQQTETCAPDSLVAKLTAGLTPKAIEAIAAISFDEEKNVPHRHGAGAQATRLAAKTTAGLAPDAVMAISFNEEKNQNTRGELVMATSPAQAQVEVDGEVVDSDDAD